MSQPAISTPEQAILLLRDSNTSPEIKLKAASFLILENHYNYYLEVIDTLRPLESAFSKNVEWLYCMGYGLVTQHRPAESITFLVRTIIYIQNNPVLYVALTWAYLQTGDFGSAFLTSSAGLQNCSAQSSLPGLNYLSKVLFQGHRVVVFPKDGIDFKYALFTSNTQEIEAALHHLTHQFTENDELEMLKANLREVDSIAEVGCLVGNHSVYFLNYFKPKRLTIIDASRISLVHTKTNIDLNIQDPESISVEYVHSAVGNKADAMTFFGEDVPVNSLSTLLSEAYDFIKIDVDGMEMEALEGVTAYLTQHKPRIMIEVLHELKPEFDTYLTRVDYRIVGEIQRAAYGNYLIASCHSRPEPGDQPS